MMVKFKEVYFFLIILNIIVLISVVVLSNLTYAQENLELHQKTLYELSKHTSLSQNAHITVGKKPTAIAVADYTHTVYVANTDDGTVSVIDVRNNTKIGNDIKVGSGPRAIAVDDFTHTVYVANTDDGTVSVINGTANYTKIGNDIKVGEAPNAIAFDDITSKLYVANTDDGTVSVIDVRNNTKIGNDIKVGETPRAIAVDHETSKLYVANTDDGTVSVINGTANYTKIRNLREVGGVPWGIGVDVSSNKVYVANTDDGTVSVINGTANYTKIGNDIKVGSGPRAIAVDDFTHTVYVANTDDGTVSVIDGKANKVVAGVIFNVKPINAGHIECDSGKLIAPAAQQFYLWPGSECTAKPNQGFDFVSWQENLNGNSTQLIKVASPSSFFDPVLDRIHPRPDKSESTLNITKFGSFTANFKALPPPIPPEYVATLFTVVATAFIGSWLTPTVIGWRKTKKQGYRLDHYHNELKKLYYDRTSDKNYIGKLSDLGDNISDEYTRGKINKEQCDKLGDEISLNYREIFTRELGSLNSNSENDKIKQLSEIKSNIEDVHVKGKINDEHYTDLKKEISILYEEIFKKRIASLINLPENDAGKRLDKIKDEISDAYSKEKIIELHYTLLKEKLSNYDKG